MSESGSVPVSAEARLTPGQKTGAKLLGPLWHPQFRGGPDSVYAGERVANATPIVVEIVRKLPNQVGFKLLPRRWVVERFFAWIGRNRRLAKDFEATIDSARAFLYAASVMLLVRRIARA